MPLSSPQDLRIKLLKSDSEAFAEMQTQLSLVTRLCAEYHGSCTMLAFEVAQCGVFAQTYTLRLLLLSVVIQVGVTSSYSAVLCVQ